MHSLRARGRNNKKKQSQRELHYLTSPSDDVVDWHFDFPLQSRATTHKNPKRRGAQRVLFFSRPPRPVFQFMAHS